MNWLINSLINKQIGQDVLFIYKRASNILVNETKNVDFQHNVDFVDQSHHKNFTSDATSELNSKKAKYKVGQLLWYDWSTIGKRPRQYRIIEVDESKEGEASVYGGIDESDGTINHSLKEKIFSYLYPIKLALGTLPSDPENEKTIEDYLKSKKRKFGSNSQVNPYTIELK